MSVGIPPYSALTSRTIFSLLGMPLSELALLQLRTRIGSQYRLPIPVGRSTQHGAPISPSSTPSSFSAIPTMSSSARF